MKLEWLIDEACIHNSCTWDHGNCEQVTLVMIPLNNTQARSMRVTWNTPTPKMVRSSKNWNNKVRLTLNFSAAWRALEAVERQCQVYSKG